MALPSRTLQTSGEPQRRDRQVNDSTLGSAVSQKKRAREEGWRSAERVRVGFPEDVIFKRSPKALTAVHLKTGLQERPAQAREVSGMWQVTDLRLERMPCQVAWSLCGRARLVTSKASSHYQEDHEAQASQGISVSLLLCLSQRAARPFKHLGRSTQSLQHCALLSSLVTSESLPPHGL